MSVLALNSDEMTEGYRGRPINDHGKIRVQYFNVPAVAVAGDIASTIELCELPPGKVRVIPALSKFNNSAWGAARTLDIGHRTYQKRDSASETFEAEDADAFVAAADVSAVGEGRGFDSITKFDLYSKAGVNVFATVAGGTIPVGATLSGFIAYVTE